MKKLICIIAISLAIAIMLPYGSAVASPSDVFGSYFVCGNFTAPAYWGDYLDADGSLFYEDATNSYSLKDLAAVKGNIMPYGSVKNYQYYTWKSSEPGVTNLGGHISYRHPDYCIGNIIKPSSSLQTGRTWYYILYDYTVDYQHGNTFHYETIRGIMLIGDYHDKAEISVNSASPIQANTRILGVTTSNYTTRPENYERVDGQYSANVKYVSNQYQLNFPVFGRMNRTVDGETYSGHGFFNVVDIGLVDWDDNSDTYQEPISESEYPFGEDPPYIPGANIKDIRIPSLTRGWEYLRQFGTGAPSKNEMLKLVKWKEDNDNKPVLTYIILRNPKTRKYSVRLLGYYDKYNIAPGYKPALKYDMKIRANMGFRNDYYWQYWAVDQDNETLDTMSAFLAKEVNSTYGYKSINLVGIDYEPNQIYESELEMIEFGYFDPGHINLDPVIKPPGHSEDPYQEGDEPTESGFWESLFKRLFVPRNIETWAGDVFYSSVNPVTEIYKVFNRLSVVAQEKELPSVVWQGVNIIQLLETKIFSQPTGILGLSLMELVRYAGSGFFVFSLYAMVKDIVLSIVGQEEGKKK